MNKLLIYTFLSTIGIYSSANAFTPWWEQPTVCRISTNKCYSSSMKDGIDGNIWDSDSNCWGQKIICAEALEKSEENTPMSKTEISKVNKDFDTSKLSSNNECYGQRYTKSNGTQALINGNYVKVWCHGILDRVDETTPNGEKTYRVDETTPNGEITFGPQPTCQYLADKHFIAVINNTNKCYGKEIDKKYTIQCDNDEKPSALIITNGAGTYANRGNNPQTKTDADAKYQEMYRTSVNRKRNAS